MVGPKIQAFRPRIHMLKGNRCILRIRGAPVGQKVTKLYFQSQFSMSKIDGSFSKKKSYKNINLGDYFFLTSIFEPLHFLKSCPNFDELVLPLFSKYNGFIWACQFLGKKLAFLDPPSLKFHDRTDIILHMMKVQSLQEIFAKVSSVSSFLNNVVKSSKVIVMH